jgi:hypothetical protein
VKVYRPPVILEGKFLRYYYPRVKICKEKYVSIVDRINVGDWIDLIPEPTNQYDKNAIVVSCRSTNTKLGYIYRGTHQEMCCRWEKNDKLLLSKITEIDSENNVYIYLAFYDTIFQDMYKNRFKVSISENKYFSCNLDKGDEVSILYDFEKDKYSIDDWGTVPKSSKVFFESIGNDNNYVSFIENIEENDSGNYKITVATVYADDK